MILKICLFSIQNETVRMYVHIKRRHSNIYFFRWLIVKFHCNIPMEIINRCERFNSIQSFSFVLCRWCGLTVTYSTCGTTTIKRDME